MNHNLQTVVQINDRRSEEFVIGRSVRHSFSLSPFLFVLALVSLLCSLRDGAVNPALRGVPLAGCLRAKVSAYADDITVFVSRWSDIEAVKKAVERHEEVACANINFDKSDWLSAWRGGVPLLGPFCWSDGPVHIFGVWFGPGLQLERNWSEVRAKVEVQVGTWHRRCLSLNSRAEVCTVYVFPLILYRLSVFPVPRSHQHALTQSLPKLLWSGRKLMVRRQVCYQRLQNEGLGMPDLGSHRLAERLTYLGRFLRLCGDKRETPFLAWSSAPKPKVVVSLGVKHRSLASTVRASVTLLVSKRTVSGISGGFHFSRRAARMVAGRCSLSMQLGFLTNEFSLTWWFTWNTLPLADWDFKAGLADVPDCLRCDGGLEETALHVFYYCEQVHPFWSHVGEWTNLIDPKQLVLLDVGYVVDNVDPPYRGEKRVLFLAILAVARIMIWETRNKGVYDGANFSHRDLILFFRHQLRVKIRCDRKRMDRITFDKRWVHGDDGPNPSGPHLR